jgi:hypothetical protein
MNAVAMVRPLNKLSKSAFSAIDQNSNEQDMKWFVAKIIFKIYSEGAKASQFDEHLRLISAAGFDEAFLKARILGISEEETLVTERNRPLKWEFINVAELIPLNELRDGSEIYSSIHETSEGNNYVQHVHQRAVLMQTKQRPLI